jgi:hypothetical protein
MSGPKSALGAHLSDDPARREPGRASTMCWPSTTSQRMGDKNEQYLLDHWRDCRRYCRAVLFLGFADASSTGGGAVRCGVEEGWVGGYVLAGLVGGASAWTRRCRSSWPKAESASATSPDLGPRSPPTGLVASGGLRGLRGVVAAASAIQVSVGCTGTSRSWSRPRWYVCSRPPAATRCSCSRPGRSTTRPAAPGPSGNCK